MSMNLHAIAAPIVGVVNGHSKGTVRLSMGYATLADGSRVPKYRDTPDVLMQVQSLTGPELRQLDGLNVQGTKRGVYLYGDVEAVVRPRDKGGDLLLIGRKEYLVVQVLEAWQTWCKVAVVEQSQ